MLGLGSEVAVAVAQKALQARQFSEENLIKTSAVVELQAQIQRSSSRLTGA